MYELGTAFAQKYGAAAGWDRLLRLWIAAGPLQIHAWRVTDFGPPIVADGCEPSNWFESLRAVNDDDGDLSNGVPDGAEIFEAFNNHGIACPSDPFVGLDVATCPVIPSPAVTLSYSALDDSEAVSWTPVPGATGYRVLRSLLGPEGAFTPIATTGLGQTSYVDTEGTRLAVHWYTVVALGTGNCESPLATVVRSTDCVPSVALAEPFAGETVDPASAVLSWTLGPNASRYDLYLSTAADPGLYLQTAETSITVPSGSLAPGSTYRWKVAASNDAGGCPPAVSEIRSFTVSGHPAIPSLGTVEPGSGPASGGTLITLAGANLYLGAAVSVGGLPAAVTSWGDGSTIVVTSPPHAPGPADVVVTNPDGRFAALPGGFSYICLPAPPLTIQAPSTAVAGQGSLVASVAEDPAYTSYAWTLLGGEIVAGQGTHTIIFRAGMPGPLDLAVVGTPGPGCLGADPAHATVSVVPARADYYTLPPCRLLDTRDPVGPLGGPSLQVGVPRTFPVAGTCGIPTDATAVSVNITVTNPSAEGAVSLAPSGFPSQLPTIVFGAGATRANFATLSIVGIPSGAVDATALMPAGIVDLIIDVSGYYR
jgi:hypothetical protein